jgi:hypothetical protein
VTEIRRPARVVLVDMACDHCSVGRMRFSGVVLTTNPPQYPHTCTSCGTTATYGNTYPHLDYEPTSP